MFLRYPNKPNEVWPEQIQLLEDEDDSFADQKTDGWRCFAFRDKSRTLVETWGGDPSWARKGGWFFVSRRDLAKGGPVNFEVSDQIVEDMVNLRMPDQTMIDCEWLARRTKDMDVPECLYLFDLLWLDDAWRGNIGALRRRESLQNMTAGNLTEFVRMPDMVRFDFVKFFEKQKSIPYTEGIVIKGEDSEIDSSRKGCTKTGAWQKVKWRRGHDGRDVI